MRGKPLAISALLVACGPERGDEVPEGAAERYADAMCSAYEECGCQGMATWSHPSGDACREQTVAVFRRAEAWEGSFSLECFERLLEWIPTTGCTADGWKFYEDFPDCFAFTGSVARGEACSAEWDGGYGQLLGQECAGSSTCVGYCVGPNQPVRVGEGERCNGRDIRCDSTSIPGGTQDLYCSSEGVCRPQVALGESCDTPRACASPVDHYCAGLTVGGTGTCQQRIPEGDACNPDAAVDGCDPGLVGVCSRDGVCVTAMPKICEAVTGNLQVFAHLAFVPAEVTD